jgi:transposase
MQRHRARHAAHLKEIVSWHAVREMAGWLERANPPQSENATPVLPVVRAVTWHLRVGGSWRSLPAGMPPGRTVYGWFRRWTELGLFERMMRDWARLRRRAVGRKPNPRLAIIDTQTVKCLSVRGPRGFDAAKRTVGRQRVAMVDADGN